MGNELEHSPRSWLDNFTQPFSWCLPSARASLFLNNYFLPGVTTNKIDVVGTLGESQSLFLLHRICTLYLVTNKICYSVNIFVFRNQFHDRIRFCLVFSFV